MLCFVSQMSDYEAYSSDDVSLSSVSSFSAQPFYKEPTSFFLPFVFVLADKFTSYVTFQRCFYKKQNLKVSSANTQAKFHSARVTIPEHFETGFMTEISANNYFTSLTPRGNLSLTHRKPRLEAVVSAEF